MGHRRINQPPYRGDLSQRSALVKNQNDQNQLVVDSIWIQNVSFFFMGTIALSLTQYIDRFFIQYYQGEASVGIYTFYSSIANVVQVFLLTGLATILYPKIIHAYQAGQLDVYRALMRKLSTGIFVAGGCFVILAIIGVKIMLIVIDKPLYAMQMPVFWLLVIAIYVGAITWIPHYALYARKADKQIVIGSLIVLPLSIIGNFVLVPAFGITGAASVVLFSNIVRLILNLYYLYDHNARARKLIR